jgi:undecaprenyl-diphosphatase
VLVGGGAGMSAEPTVWQAVVLGVVQGLTEFLPVSSSGHLVILPQLLGWPSPPLAFDVALHFGTLLSLMALYGRDLAGMAAAVPRALARRGGARDDQTLAQARLAGLVVLACVPAGVAGVLFEDTFESLFRGFGAVGAALMVTGVILWIAEALSRVALRERISAWDALWVGIAQAFAIVPGISRSGLTIAAGLARGLGREESPRFAFLISVPVILGATLFAAQGVLSAGPSPGALLSYAVGTFTAALSGWAAIKVVLRAVIGGRLHYFSYYCWSVGAVVVVLAVLGLV